MASVEALRRQENTKRIADYFRANPIRAGLNLRGLNPSYEGRAPSYNEQARYVGKPKVRDGLIYHRDYKGYFDNPIYGNKPQYISKPRNDNGEFEYGKAKQYYNGKQLQNNAVIIPRYQQESSKYKLAPIRQVGKAVLQRPHYNVLPNWWG